MPDKDYKIDKNGDDKNRHSVIGIILEVNKRYCLLLNAENKYRPISGHIYNIDNDPNVALDRVAKRYGLELITKELIPPKEEIEWSIPCYDGIINHYTYSFLSTATENSAWSLIKSDKRIGLYTLNDIKFFRNNSMVEPNWANWLKKLEQD